ncbi:MAG: DNA gyrase subunit B [Clostridia bacterium]|nr:DNA gyrase subunit B [Clostridia bacterium]
MTKSYRSEDILVLEGLDAVRLRPGMYIGTTGVKGLHHLLWEIVDNAIDEASNGFANKVVVNLYKDGSASVEDNGRGVPVDIHPELKKSGVEVVFTQLHAGGKFNNENYSYSGGLHGVGASVTNALSKWCEVTVFKDGKEYFARFESVIDKKGKQHSGVCVSPLKQVGATSKNGTFVHFLPDSEVFKDATFEYDTVAKRLKELAFLNKGIEIILNCEKTGQSEVYKYDGGLADFVKYINTDKISLFQPVLYIEGQSEIVKLELAISYTDSYTDSVFSYVNNIPTTEGGTHENGFRIALTKVMNELGRKNNFIKEKEQNLISDDYKEGLTAILSIKMKNVQFEGQTKTKLGNPEAKAEVETIVINELTRLLARKEFLKAIETIVGKAKGASKAREAARKAKELTRAKNSIDSTNLVGKLSACTGRKAELNELFIVEGDSAGGSAKQARDRYYQAILPLKGKPLNAEKKRLDQVLQNEEIRTLISALGCGVGDIDLKSLKYHKIIILSDADQDGAHIRAILLTFFFRYMKELITNGHIYIGMPPLYKVSKGKEIEYVYSDKELPDAIARIGKGYQIQRYKGLGEMNPEQLWETTIDPKHRTLVRVDLEDGAEAERMITILMGDNADARKAYIAKYADFNKKDLLDDVKK